MAVRPRRSTTGARSWASQEQPSSGRTAWPLGSGWFPAQVVGARDLVPENSPTAFLWERGKVTNLPSLTGSGGNATAINKHGVIVGSSPTGHGEDVHAVLWH